MQTTTTSQNTKRLGLAIASIAAAMLLVMAWLATAVNASSIVQVTSNIADVPGGDDLVLTVGTQNDGDVHELEIDHSLQGTLPEFSVYADETNPYGGQTCGPDSDKDCKTEFQAAGVTVTYSASASQWVIDFGPMVSDAIRANDTISFYLVLRDADDNILWGSMDQPTPESTFVLDAVAGTGDSLVPEPVEDEDDENDAVIPGVPNTSVGQ